MNAHIGAKTQNVWTTASLRPADWQKEYARKLFLEVSG